MMPTDNHPDMSREDHRFASFLNWPGTPSPSLLADAGFYYTGVGNQVKCFSCGGTVSNWDSTMPDKVHRERFPFCALVNNREHTHQPWVPSMRTVRLAEEVMPDLFNSSGPAPNMMGMALLNNTTETEAATQRQRPRLAAASSRPSMASTGATQYSTEGHSDGHVPTENRDFRAAFATRDHADTTAHGSSKRKGGQEQELVQGKRRAMSTAEEDDNNESPTLHTGSQGHATTAEGPAKQVMRLRSDRQEHGAAASVAVKGSKRTVTGREDEGMKKMKNAMGNQGDDLDLMFKELAEEMEALHLKKQCLFCHKRPACKLFTTCQHVVCCLVCTDKNCNVCPECGAAGQLGDDHVAPVDCDA